jgi:hypothetical protein
MINANELKINNWVLNKDGNIFSQVKGIQSSGFVNFEYNTRSWYRIDHPSGSEIEPIPLSEEILLKCPKDLIFPKWIKFLHDLQNWYYYNNCKKELEIKL